MRGCGEGVEIVRRHSVGGIVYQRRTWILEVSKFQADIAGLSAARAFVAVDRWRLQHGLPDQVYLAEPVVGSGNSAYSKPQYIDFTSGLFVELFGAILNRGSRRIRLSEALPSPREIPRQGHGERLAVEIQLESCGFAPPPMHSPFPVLEGSL